jgi:hypothetical protein
MQYTSTLHNALPTLTERATSDQEGDFGVTIVLHCKNMCNIADRSPTAFSDRRTCANGWRRSLYNRHHKHVSVVQTVLSFFFLEEKKPLLVTDLSQQTPKKKGKQLDAVRHKKSTRKPSDRTFT